MTDLPPPPEAPGHRRRGGRRILAVGAGLVIACGTLAFGCAAIAGHDASGPRPGNNERLPNDDVLVILKSCQQGSRGVEATGTITNKAGFTTGFRLKILIEGVGSGDAWIRNLRPNETAEWTADSAGRVAGLARCTGYEAYTFGV